jgi:DNA-binding transcriptional ArsR family regulator
MTSSFGERIKLLRFFSIPMELGDLLFKLPPAEMKVAVLICRKTFGFGKPYDAISLSQIYKATNLSKATVARVLRSLETAGITYSFEQPGGKPSFRGVNPKYWSGADSHSEQRRLDLALRLDATTLSQASLPACSDSVASLTGETGVGLPVRLDVSRRRDTQKKSGKTIIKKGSPPSPPLWVCAAS